jgi:hypothetical protein
MLLTILEWAGIATGGLTVMGIMACGVIYWLIPDRQS